MKNLKKQLINFRLLLTRNGIQRGEYLKKKKVFKFFGDNVWYQPYKIPTQPHLVKIGNNVKIATEVMFLEHDVMHSLLNIKYNTHMYKEKLGTIEIGDNTFIGGRSTILYNVKIGSNCLIAAGSVVTKDIPDNSVAAGVPCKVIGNIEKIEKNMKEYSEKLKDINIYDENEMNKIFWKE